MRRLIAALAAALMTVVLTPGPAHAVDYSTKLKDTHKDVTVVTPKVKGNQDVDIYQAFYQYASSSMPNPQLVIELKLRRLDPSLPTSQLYVTEFKTGHKRYQVHVNSEGGWALYVWSGHAGAWLNMGDGCEVVPAIHPGTSYIGGDITIYLNSCFPSKRAKIVWTQARNYRGLDLASYDQVTVKRRIGKP